MTSGAPDKRRLESWKEIAAYFRRTDRTVRRWEAELGLPVRRTPGQRQSRVHADVAELESWWRRAGAAADQSEEAGEEAAPGLAAANAPAPSARIERQSHGANSRRLAKRMGAAGAILVMLALAVAAQRGLWAAKIFFTPSRPPLGAQRLYVAGMDDWAARTPASLERAVDEFRAAIGRYPRYAEAYAGLALTYDLLREYTRMPAAQAYGLARESATRALELDDHLSSAHAALAFADYFGFWNAAAGQAQFQRAIALDPANATARHWYATFLLERGRFGGALAQIDAARALEPASAAITSDRAMILHSLARNNEAEAILRAVARARPEFKSPHAYLSVIAFDQGRLAEFLAEAEAAARLGGDSARVADLDAAGRALNDGGRPAMLASLLASEKIRYEAGDEEAYPIARWAALAGQRAEALHFLSLSADRREAEFAAALTDPAFADLRADPSFRALVARLDSPAI